MKWVRLGFASVAIILYLALSLLYIQSLASHETFPKEVASIVLTLLGNIAGYYFLTRHFGGSKQL
jgi:positive regulator of sigma E activity